MNADRRFARLLVIGALIATSVSAPTSVAQASSAPRAATQAAAAPAIAPTADSPTPSSVVIAGSRQGELGCPGDWDPTCATTGLSDDPADDVWQGTFDVPAGDFEYKAALNGGWDENYGANATLNGANVALSVPATTPVKFYYDHETHWVDRQRHLRDSHRGRQLPERARLRGRLAAGLPALLAAGPRRRRHLQLLDRLDPRRQLRVQGRASTSRGTSATARTAARTTSPSPSAGPATRHHLLLAERQRARGRPSCGQGSGTLPGDADLAGDSLRQSVVGQNFYFVLPDRFANGDPSNDTAGAAPGAGPARARLSDPTDKGYYHGGDLAGLADKLDYLDDLGVDAMWLTPMFKNRSVQGDGTTDGLRRLPRLLDRRLHPDRPALRHERRRWPTLIAAAHAKGINVYFDIITNHTADVIKYEEGDLHLPLQGRLPLPRRRPATLRRCRGTPGTPALPGAGRRGRSRTPRPWPRPLADAKTPAWLNDLIYYHNRGDIDLRRREPACTATSSASTTCSPRIREVVDGMIDIFSHLDQRARASTASGSTPSSTSTTSSGRPSPRPSSPTPQANGKPDFFFFGEVFDGNPSFTSRFTTELKLPAVLDFAVPGQGFASSPRVASATGLRDLFAPGRPVHRR